MLHKLGRLIVAVPSVVKKPVLLRAAFIVIVVAALFNSAVSIPAAAACGTTNVALGKAATASSTENGGTGAPLAVDGNTGTRWSSAFSDPQWLQVDLGSPQSICGVTILWEAAYGKSYTIQTSPDANTWTTIFSTTTGDGGTDTLIGLSGSGRYIRMYGTVRATQYGYSIFEFRVYVGSGGPTATNTPTGTKTNTPTPTMTFTPSITPTTGAVDFGPNVIIFDPGMSASSIQTQVNKIFTIQQSNQFCTDHYTIMSNPETTVTDANNGLYT